MEIKYSEKSQELTFRLDEKDFYKALQIEEMIKGTCICRKCGTAFQSEGWKVLMGYIEEARERIILSGEEGTASRAKRQNSDLKFAQLKGLDTIKNLPDLIIMQANLQREAIKKKEEISHEANDE